MKVLNLDELQIAEAVLLKHFPRSLRVYGFIHAINRKKPSTLEVIVDAWPDFKVIICRPDLKNKLTLEFIKRVSYYSMDEQTLRKMVAEENVIDWSAYFLLGGFDSSQSAMFKELSANRQVNCRLLCTVRLLYLPDSSHLLTTATDSEIESRIESLDLSHVDLVNKTWKFGGDKHSYMNIKKLISNFPSYCITDGQGQPMSWVLTHDYCAIGMLHTVPEHRGKGYAKVLVSTLARRLQAKGYPVYCVIEEENDISYKLFKSLGFIEVPSYREQSFEFNF